MNIIQDLSERVLTEDHSPYEWWETRQLDIFEGVGAGTPNEMKVLRARPEVWRALRAQLAFEKDKLKR